METRELKHILEAALLAAGKPLDVGQLRALFGDDDPPERDEIRAALTELEADYEERGIMLKEVASGFRIQARPSVSGWLQKLWDERPPRYSRALMETLAIIAYRQPVTRGDVENIRGVGVTTNIMRSLLERNWIRIVGYRDVPGKPAMYGTTREFLDYFGLKRLDDLPPLAELRDLGHFEGQLSLGDPAEQAAGDTDLDDDEERRSVAAPGEVAAVEASAPDDEGRELDPDNEYGQDQEERDEAVVLPLHSR